MCGIRHASVPHANERLVLEFCALRASLPWSPSLSLLTTKHYIYQSQVADVLHMLLDKYGLRQQLEQLLTLWRSFPKKLCLPLTHMEVANLPCNFRTPLYLSNTVSFREWLVLMPTCLQSVKMAVNRQCSTHFHVLNGSALPQCTRNITCNIGRPLAILASNTLKAKQDFMGACQLRYWPIGQQHVQVRNYWICLKHQGHLEYWLCTLSFCCSFERWLYHVLPSLGAHLPSCLAFVTRLACSRLYLAKLSKSLSPHIPFRPYSSVLRLTGVCVLLCITKGLRNDKGPENQM